jgi:putative transposase
VDVGKGDVQRLCRLSHGIDKLCAKIEGCKQHKRRLRLRRAKFRVYKKIRHLTDEVHWQTANYLCRTFDTILLPEFGTSEMVKKRHANGSWKRKISRNTSRRMLLWSHYRFRQRLIEKAKQHGTAIVIVNEAFTSKTCSRCGYQNHRLGGSKVFKCRRCDLVSDRDVNGARNILLRNVCTAPE